MLAQIAHHSSNITLSLSHWPLQSHAAATAVISFLPVLPLLCAAGTNMVAVCSTWPCALQHLAVCAPVINRDVNLLELGRRPWSSPTLDSGRRSRVEEREVDPESGDYAVAMTQPSLGMLLLQTSNET